MRIHHLGLVVSAMLALILSSCGPKKVEVLVTAYDFAFQPDTVEVPAGAEVTLTLVNHGNAEHVWLVLERDHELTLPFDEDDSPHVLARTIADVTGRETFTFAAPAEPGEYTVVCSIPGHAEAGMLGRLIVR
ncbi:MAG TPA: cupredoxin domain-containing protein [Anaerolineales bacterium]|nr:cupredoxin domain-containing protein [Anaerolineales bacterium]